MTKFIWMRLTVGIWWFPFHSISCHSIKSILVLLSLYMHSIAAWINLIIRTNVSNKSILLMPLTHIAKLSPEWAASNMYSNDTHFWFYPLKYMGLSVDWTDVSGQQSARMRDLLPSGMWTLPWLEPEMTVPQLNPLTAALGESLSWRTQLNCTPIPHCWNLWNKKCLLLSTAKFGWFKYISSPAPKTILTKSHQSRTVSTHFPHAQQHCIVNLC